MRRSDLRAGGDARGPERLLLYELTPQQATLEEAFIDITQGEVEFKAHAELESAHETKEVPA